MPQASPSHIKISGMVDIKADINITSADTGPQSWPTTAGGFIVAVLGATIQSCLSSKPMLVKNPQTATIHPYVMVAPLNLGQPRTDWGRTSYQHGESG